MVCVGCEMYMLAAREVNTVQNTLRTGQTLVPHDNITHIRISFYSLRLAKSDVFTPRLWEYHWVVDQHINSLRQEEEFSSIQTSSNNLTGLEKKFQSNKDYDGDSGYSDG